MAMRRNKPQISPEMACFSGSDGKNHRQIYTEIDPTHHIFVCVRVCAIKCNIHVFCLMSIIYLISNMLENDPTDQLALCGFPKRRGLAKAGPRQQFFPGSVIFSLQFQEFLSDQHLRSMQQPCVTDTCAQGHKDGVNGQLWKVAHPHGLPNRPTVNAQMVFNVCNTSTLNEMIMCSCVPRSFLLFKTGNSSFVYRLWLYKFMTEPRVNSVIWVNSIPG